MACTWNRNSMSVFDKLPLHFNLACHHLQWSSLFKVMMVFFTAFDAAVLYLNSDSLQAGVLFKKI